MFRLLNNRRGQNTAEYAILIGVIVAAAIAMQIYVRRGMQARVKDAVDYSITQDTEGGNPDVFTSEQYEPYYLESNYDTEQASRSTENMAQGGAITRTVDYESTTRVGNITYSAYDNSTM